MSLDQRLADLVSAVGTDVKGLSSKLAERPGAAFSRLMYAGHSGMAHGGASIPDRGWGETLGAMLRAETWSIAKGGAVLSWHESGATPGDGGWVNVVNNMVFPPRKVLWTGPYNAGTQYYEGDGVTSGGNWYRAKANTLGNAPTNTTYWTQITSEDSPGATKYIPRSEVDVFFYGNNDLGFVKDLTTYLETMRYILSLSQMSIIWQDNHPNISYSAGFAARNAANIITSYGTGFRTMPAAVGETITILVPPDSPNGTVDLGFVVSLGAGLNDGTVSVKVDGVVTVNKDFAGLKSPTSGKNSPSVIRVPVTAGAHTLVVTTTTACHGVYFNWVGFEAVPVPPTVVVSLFKPRSYTIWTQSVSDADVDAWNVALKNLLDTEFPEAIWVDIAGLLNSDKYFSYDSVHPNDLGHALIAAAVYVAMLAADVAPEMAAMTGQDFRINNAGYKMWNFDNFIIPAGTADKVFVPILDNGLLCTFVIRAQVGDLLLIGTNGLWGNQTPAGYFDLAVMDVRLATPVPIRWASSGTAVQLTNGLTFAIAAGNAQPPLCPGIQPLKVMPGDVLGGVITLCAHVAKVGVGVSRTVAKLGPQNSLLNHWENKGPMNMLREPWAL